MTIHSVFSSAFRPYGQIFFGYETEDLLQTLEAVAPMPQEVRYVPSQPELEALPIAKELSERAYGGMPIQLGWCSGHNTKLNCLEYHRDSEINLGTRDFILLLGKQEQIGADGLFDTANVKAFLVPAGLPVEIFATTLHYAPAPPRKVRISRCWWFFPKEPIQSAPSSRPKTERIPC